MKSFLQHIRDCAPNLHDDAFLLTLSDYIDALSLLNAQVTRTERIVEIREDCPEPGTYAVRLVPVEVEKEDHK